MSTTCHPPFGFLRPAAPAQNGMPWTGRAVARSGCLFELGRGPHACAARQVAIAAEAHHHTV
jgi:hypothetical protein